MLSLGRARITACSLTLALAAVPLASQTVVDTVRPGDGSVDGSFIRPFAVTWLATPRSADGVARASFTVAETYELVGDAGAQLLTMTQTWNDTLGEPLFITVRVADHATLSYRAFHTGRTPTGLAHLDIDGVHVSGFYAPEPEQRARMIGVVLDEPVFASIAGLLLAAFPLEENTEATLPGFGWGGSNDPAIVWHTMRVVGHETISVPRSGDMDAWVVESARGAGTPVRYWLSRTAPYFLKAEARGSNGTITTFVVSDWKWLD